MDKLSPEIEALITAIVCQDCRLDAILQLLAEKNISLDPEEINSATHQIHSVQGDVKRYQIVCRIKAP